MGSQSQSWPLYSRDGDPVPFVQEAGRGLGAGLVCPENLTTTEFWARDRPIRSESVYLLTTLSRPLEKYGGWRNRTSPLPVLTVSRWHPCVLPSFPISGLFFPRAVYTATLKTGAARSSETPSYLYQIIRRYISLDNSNHNHRCENRRSRLVCRDCQRSSEVAEIEKGVWWNCTGMLLDIFTTPMPLTGVSCNKIWRNRCRSSCVSAEHSPPEAECVVLRCIGSVSVDYVKRRWTELSYPRQGRWRVFKIIMLLTRQASCTTDLIRC